MSLNRYNINDIDIIDKRDRNNNFFGKDLWNLALTNHKGQYGSLLKFHFPEPNMIGDEDDDEDDDDDVVRTNGKLPNLLGKYGSSSDAQQQNNQSGTKSHQHITGNADNETSTLMDNVINKTIQIGKVGGTLAIKAVSTGVKKGASTMVSVVNNISGSSVQKAKQILQQKRNQQQRSPSPRERTTADEDDSKAEFENETPKGSDDNETHTESDDNETHTESDDTDNDDTDSDDNDSDDNDNDDIDSDDNDNDDNDSDESSVPESTTHPITSQTSLFSLDESVMHNDVNNFLAEADEDSKTTDRLYDDRQVSQWLVEWWGSMRASEQATIDKLKKYLKRNTDLKKSDITSIAQNVGLDDGLQYKKKQIAQETPPMDVLREKWKAYRDLNIKENKNITHQKLRALFDQTNKDYKLGLNMHKFSFKRKKVSYDGQQLFLMGDGNKKIEW